MSKEFDYLRKNQLQKQSDGRIERKVGVSAGIASVLFGSAAVKFGIDGQTFGVIIEGGLSLLCAGTAVANFHNAGADSNAAETYRAAILHDYLPELMALESTNKKAETSQQPLHNSI